MNTLINILSWAIGIAMLIAALIVLGMLMDGNDRYHAEHDRCLKEATNGYAIKECH